MKKKYQEFLLDNIYDDISIERKIEMVAEDMIKNFETVQKENHKMNYANFCKRSEDLSGFIMKIKNNTYVFTYEEIINNLPKNLLRKVKDDYVSIEDTIFSLLQEKKAEI